MNQFTTGNERLTNISQNEYKKSIFKIKNKTMKHTQGKATVSNFDFKKDSFEVNLENEKGIDTICKTTFNSSFKQEAEANAELIAEAFNVTNECGFTPRQLLEQRNELLDALNNMCGWKSYLSNRFYESNQVVKCDELENDYKKAINAINYAQKK